MLLVVLSMIATSPSSARQAAIGAIQDRVDALHDAGDYTGAIAEGWKLEAVVKARLGTSHPAYAAALMQPRLTCLLVYT